ncbi:hypothetical protein [Egicoccus sp. AB-alg6-2]|uniref:hypothetical protein n=1 Tax=Egicoccus sp. AB-alg6-2 TaxID=3242692 RepID=UPI00359E3035
MIRLRGALRREQLRAAVLLAVPMLLALVLWGAVLGADRDGVGAESVAGVPEGSGGDDEADTGSVEATGESRRERAEREGATAGGAAGRGPSEDTDEPVTIEFDGRCEVEVEPAEQDDELRPWHFDACEHAPIPLTGSQKRWIVVVASLWGEDFTEREARARVEATGGGAQLLWSSHYPSLNPDLWVVAEGPFDDEDAAQRAADRIGGGAYARELSDDEGDRYCIAADGCVGETRSVRLD